MAERWVAWRRTATSRTTTVSTADRRLTTATGAPTNAPANAPAVAPLTAIRRARQPLGVRVRRTLADYARRVWDNSGEDDIFFLAGGIAFNILLAVVPFTLLLVTGVAYVLQQTADASTAEVSALLDRLLPGGVSAGSMLLRDAIADAIRTRGRVGLLSAVSFVWFSTRLFGSLRSVLAEVFDIDQERGIVAGKLFDVKVTVVSTLLVVAYSALSAYLSLATSSGVRVLISIGVRQDVMGGLEYWAGRAVAFSFITAMFFALYKTLPNRRIRWQTALLAATFAGGLLEVAKMVFTLYVRSFNPGSLYTGTLAAFVIVVVWVYYASVVFILGGEVAQVFDLRHVRRVQRAVLED